MPALSQVELLQEEQDQLNWNDVRASIEACRDTQVQRAGKLNSELSLLELNTYCDLDEEQRAGLASIMDKLSMSARATHRVIKMARTIADFEGSEVIREQDLMEAISYRRCQLSKLITR